MANMSYCRFHNTEMDMGDCLEALINEEPLSKSEASCCKRMFGSIMDYLYEEGVIEPDEDAWIEWKQQIDERSE